MKLTHVEEKIIRTLLKARGKKLDIWEICRRCGYLLHVINSVEFLNKRGVTKIKDSVISLVNTNDLPRYVLKKEKSIEKVLQKYIKYKKRVGFVNDDYDQMSITPKAVKNKLSVMLKENDLLERDILCIGDDDLFSVACSLTGLPKSITVFDIDKKVIGFIDEISPRLPVPIKTVSVNLLKSLPKKYNNSFDIFISEPPDTVKGTLLFVSRGMQALRKNGAFYLGMTEETLNKKQWLKIEKAITQSGFAFTNIIKDCEEYVREGENELSWKGFEKLPKWINKPASKSWFVSALFRAESIGKRKPLRFSFKDAKKELITSLLP